MTVRLEELDALVREAELADDIESAIVALEGPFANRRTEREAEVRAWEALFGNARDAVADSAILVEWLDGMRSSGLLKRLTASDLPQARNLLWQAISVLRNLPREGIPLPAFAANVLGDSHALDRGTPLSSILLRGIAMLGGVDTWQSPDQRRDAWSAVGVICDELSHPVLVWNLQLPDAHPLRDWLSAGAKLGEPFYLTTRQLLRTPLPENLGASLPRVYICENPAIVGLAAERAGASNAPLVCVSGNLTTSAKTLLRQLSEGGVELFYHGDFDWPGLQIARFVFRQYGAFPWRLDAAHYRSAPEGIALQGEPVATPWDPELREAMVARGCAVHEEQVAENLLGDIQTGSG